MKIFLTIFLAIMIVGIGILLYLKIDSKKDVINTYELNVEKLESQLSIKKDSLRIWNNKNDSLDKIINLIEEKKEKLIVDYERQRKWVEEMNKEFLKSIDKNNDGIPDNVEYGDYNGNGMPDYIENDYNGNGIPDYAE